MWALRTQRRTTRVDAIVAAAVFALAFGYFYLFHELGWFMEDEGVLYYQYLRVLRGNLPYRDFFTGYGPIVYYLHAWAFSLFGVSINAIRVMLAAVNAATAAGLYVVARRITSRDFALIPPGLFVVMQPWDIAVMVFQNSPYPSWYALASAVWGTWAMLRFLEASPSAQGTQGESSALIASSADRRRTLWLVLAGFLGGLTFLAKQNAGTFFLWGISGFLASVAEPKPAADEAEPLAARILRVTYLSTIPLAALALVRNFLDAASVTSFVLPLVVLAVIGVRQRYGVRAWHALLMRLLWVTIGAVIAIGPWLFYFARHMGLVPFLTAVLLLGTDVDRNLYLPFPTPTGTTLGVLGLITLCAAVAWHAGRATKEAADSITRRAVVFILAAVPVTILGLAAWYAQVVGHVLRFEYNLWQIYSFLSKRIDNLAAYLSLLVLGTALVVAWRESRGRRRTGDPAVASFLCVLWIAAPGFILYYPRMDYAHLVGALPLLYVVAAGLLLRLRTTVSRAFRGSGERSARFAVSGVCLVLVLFIVGTKSMPKIGSRATIAHTAQGIRLVRTPREWLRIDGTHLYFPIYLERERLRVDAIRQLIAYARDARRRGEAIFTFPALPMLYFLGGPSNPTRHDYFLGDNVPFRKQLNVIRTLERKQVPLVVVPNDPSDYFVAKGKDFTRMIWDYLGERYYLERRIGPYDVLRRYGTVATSGQATQR